MVSTFKIADNEYITLSDIPSTIGFNGTNLAQNISRAAGTSVSVVNGRTVFSLNSDSRQWLANRLLFLAEQGKCSYEKAAEFGQWLTNHDTPEQQEAKPAVEPLLTIPDLPLPTNPEPQPPATIETEATTTTSHTAITWRIYMRTAPLVMLSLFASICITAPALHGLGVESGWRYIGAIALDFAAAVFVLDGRKKIGAWFAVTTAALALCNFIHEISNNTSILYVKAMFVAIGVGLAMFGYAEISKPEKRQ